METKALDFSAIDSREKAEALLTAGELERLFLFPPEFGGQDDPRNVLYVPRGIVADRRVILRIVASH